MMRGLHTPVRAIRRRVFKEVAQLGFKADEDTLLADMEAIPYAAPLHWVCWKTSSAPT